MTATADTRALKLTAVSATLLVMTALAGCSAAGGEDVSKDPVEALREQGYVEQADMLADGVVTVEEVEEAGELLRSCIVDSGHSLTIEGWNPIDNVDFLYLAEPAPGSSDDDFVAVYDMCTARYIRDVAHQYRVTTEPHMDAELMAEALVCLDSEGFRYDHDPVNQYDLVSDNFITEGDPPERAIVDECVMAEAMKMYPDIVTIGITWLALECLFRCWPARS